MMETMSLVRQQNLIDVALVMGKDGAIRLQAIARSLHRLNEASCNYGLTPRQEKHEETLEREAAEIAAKVEGWHVYRQGDPRGWPLYIWSDEDLRAYGARWDKVSDIDCCYNAVGIGVCPH